MLALGARGRRFESCLLDLLKLLAMDHGLMIVKDQVNKRFDCVHEVYNRFTDDVEEMDAELRIFAPDLQFAMDICSKHFPLCKPVEVVSADRYISTRELRFIINMN